MLMIEVVAAIITNKNQFLICQRPEHKNQGLLWEFAGGKVEKGETKEAALVRECKEELGITLSVGDVFTEAFHSYPGQEMLHITFFLAKISSGKIKKLEHREILWVTKEEIAAYSFCPANQDTLEKLKQYF